MACYKVCNNGLTFICEWWNESATVRVFVAPAFAPISPTLNPRLEDRRGSLFVMPTVCRCEEPSTRVGDPPRGRNRRALTPRRDNPPLSDRRSGQGRRGRRTDISRETRTEVPAHGAGWSVTPLREVYFFLPHVTARRKVTDWLTDK